MDGNILPVTSCRRLSVWAKKGCKITSAKRAGCSHFDAGCSVRRSLLPQGVAARPGTLSAALDWNVSFFTLGA